MDDQHAVVADDGTKLAARSWSGGADEFVLVHGLASNHETWGEVAEELRRRGHAVVAYDQRGHGRSDTPPDGYDLATAVSDLGSVIAWSGFRSPVLVGQSWGANVVLAYAARSETRHPIALVDGGLVDLQDMFATWEECAETLRPPVPGVTLQTLEDHLRAAHPEWSRRGIEATLNNLVTGPDGLAQNRLPLEAHMSLVRAMWEHPPSRHYGHIRSPVLGLLASNDQQPWTEAKRRGAAQISTSLATATLARVDGDHDLHVHHPTLVTDLLLEPGWR